MKMKTTKLVTPEVKIQLHGFRYTVMTREYSDSLFMCRDSRKDCYLTLEQATQRAKEIVNGVK